MFVYHVYAPGTGFPVAERERLGLRGLLPPRVVSMQVQVRCGAVWPVRTGRGVCGLIHPQ
jgi:hypothetical protein